MLFMTSDGAITFDFAIYSCTLLQIMTSNGASTFQLASISVLSGRQEAGECCRGKVVL